MSDTPIIPQTQPHKNLTPQQLGGRAVVAKYGRDHMSRIGKKGFQTTVDRWFGGDRDAACAWLTAKGLYVGDRQYARLGFNYFRDPGPHPAHFDQITIINIGAIE